MTDPAPDTIAAIATAPGRGGIGIVRISGPAVDALAQGVVGHALKPRVATAATFRGASGEALDAGLALYFPALGRPAITSCIPSRIIRPRPAAPSSASS